MIFTNQLATKIGSPVGAGPYAGQEVSYQLIFRMIHESRAARHILARLIDTVDCSPRNLTSKVFEIEKAILRAGQYLCSKPKPIFCSTCGQKIPNRGRY